MSLYNRLFGENPDAMALLGMIGTTRNDFQRYRDVNLNKDGNIIIVTTRLGGGNRDNYKQVFTNMRRNENYISHKKVKNPEKDWIKFENHHEAIIDKDNFIKVQERLKIQRRKTNKNDILSGYLKCADCNGAMMLVKGKKNEYYYCRNSISKKNCTKHTFRKEYLLEGVLNQINLKKLDDEKIKELSREVVIKYLDSVIVYEDNKLEVIMKYDIELMKN